MYYKEKNKASSIFQTTPPKVIVRSSEKDGFFLIFDLEWMRVAEKHTATYKNNERIENQWNSWIEARNIIEMFGQLKLMFLGRSLGRWALSQPSINPLVQVLCLLVEEGSV